MEQFFGYLNEDMLYAGTWHILEMEMWDEDYFNMEVQAFIHIEPNGIGNFQFGLVSGALDGEVLKTGKEERFEFTWEGQDENDPILGSGWLKLSGKDKVRGSIKIHLGDRSSFIAVRAEGYENTESL